MQVEFWSPFWIEFFVCVQNNRQIKLLSIVLNIHVHFQNGSTGGFRFIQMCLIQTPAKFESPLQSHLLSLQC